MGSTKATSPGPSPPPIVAQPWGRGSRGLGSQGQVMRPSLRAGTGPSGFPELEGGAFTAAMGTG